MRGRLANEGDEPEGRLVVGSCSQKALTEQPRAKEQPFELRLEVGRRRFALGWLRDRLKWLTETGQAEKPDWNLWNLSNTAQHVSELLRWQYYNPARC